MMSLCERCEDQPAVRCYAATAYYWDGKGENPNGDRWFCYDCREEYYEHWDEMWQEYYHMVAGGLAAHGYGEEV